MKIPEGNLPTELCILPWGDSFFDDGTQKLTVGAVSVAAIPAMQKKYNYDRVALDFNHNSLPQSETYKGEPVKVASYGSVEVRPGVGVFLTGLEWTPDGAAAYEGRHYCDISPTVASDPDGNVIFVHSAALCRQGRIQGLTLFSADFLENDNSKQSEIMDDTQKIKGYLLTILNLPEDSGMEAIDDAMTKFVAENDEKKPAAAPVETEAFSAKLDELSSRLSVLETDGEAAQKQTVFDAAISEGKLIPHSALKLPLADLKAFCNDAPAGIVPMGQRTPEGIKQFSAAAPASPAADSICRQLGISRETFEKYKD